MDKHAIMQETLSDKIVITGTIIATDERSVTNSVALSNIICESLSVVNDGTKRGYLETVEKFDLPTHFECGGIIGQLRAALQQVDGFRPYDMVKLEDRLESHVWSIASKAVKHSTDVILENRITSAAEEDLTSTMMEGYVLTVPEVYVEIVNENKFSTYVGGHTLTLLIENDEELNIAEDQWGHTFSIDGVSIPEMMQPRIGDTFTLIIRFVGE